MANFLRGLELLVPSILKITESQINPSESVIGCFTAHKFDGNSGAFVLLDNRLLYIHPNLHGKKVYSIEYLDIRRVEVIEHPPGLFSQGALTLSVDTTYKFPDSNVCLTTGWDERQYAINFVEVLRAKVREARTPSLKVETPEKKPATFVDELEHLANLRKQGVLTEEEFEAAKKKLLS